MLDNLMPHYRSPNPRYVKMFAQAMREGLWLEADKCGETIKVDKLLGLIDGRRRLLAIVNTGKTLNLLVVRGVFEEFPPLPLLDVKAALEFRDYLEATANRAKGAF